MLCAVSLTFGYNKKASFVKGGGAALCDVPDVYLQRKTQH